MEAHQISPGNPSGGRKGRTCDRRRDTETDSGKGEGGRAVWWWGGETTHIRNRKMGALSIQDVPCILASERKETSAIHDSSDIEIRQIIQHWGQDGHGQSDNGGNVQILEGVV